MRIGRFIVALTLLVFLSGSICAPRRAEALSSGEIAAIVVGSVAGWFTLVIVGAWLAYGRRSPDKEKRSELAADDRSVADAGDRRIRFGPECPANIGGVPGMRPTVCW